MRGTNLICCCFYGMHLCDLIYQTNQWFHEVASFTSPSQISSKTLIIILALPKKQLNWQSSNDYTIWLDYFFNTSSVVVAHHLIILSLFIFSHKKIYLHHWIANLQKNLIFLNKNWMINCVYFFKWFWIGKSNFLYMEHSLFTYICRCTYSSMNSESELRMLWSYKLCFSPHFSMHLPTNPSHCLVNIIFKTFKLKTTTITRTWWFNARWFKSFSYDA